MADIVDELRNEANRLSGRSLDRGCVDSGIAANLADKAADEIERLRAAVLRFGTHTTSCRYRGGHDCDCGLDELRAETSLASTSRQITQET